MGPRWRVAGGRRRIAWSRPSKSSSTRISRAIVRAATSPSFSQPSIQRHSRESTRSAVGRGDTELGLLDQGEQVFGPFPDLGLFLGETGHRDQRRPRFLEDARALRWVVSRIAAWISVHLRSARRRAALELLAKLDEQFLDGLSQLLA